MLLEVKNLCFSYYKKPLILRDVNLKISGGEKILILGAKDSGKSTMLKVLSGFHDTYFGNILLESKELKKISDENKNMSLLLSNPVFLKNKSISENIDFLTDTLTKEKLNDEEKNKLLEKFYINKSLKTKVKKLSSKDARIFAMLRSYIKKPNIIFLDDQFKNLNEEDCKDLVKVHNEFLNDKNLTMILALSNESFFNFDEIKKIKFDKILFLSLAHIWEYKNFDEFFNDLPVLDSIKFRKDFMEEELELVKNSNGYFLNDENGRYIKLSEKYFQSLIKLDMAYEDYEKVIVCHQKDTNVFDLSDKDFNKNLENNEILIYTKFDESRLI